MRIFRVTDGREVVVGDPVKYRGRPHYVYSMLNGLVFVVSMCERKYMFSCRPEDIDCREGACAESDTHV